MSRPSIIEDENAFYVSVRSQDCIKLEADRTTAISVLLDPPLTAGYGNGFVMKVTQLYVPYSFYNIRSINNQFNFQYVEGVTNLTFTITIPPGNWALTALLQAMQAELRAQTGNTTISSILNRSTGRVEFTLGASPIATLTCLQATGVNATVGSRQILGVTTDLAIASGTTQAGNHVASVLTIPRIILRSDAIGVNSYDTAIQNQSNALAEITVDVPLFSILSFVPQNQRSAYVLPNTVSVVNFSLTDPDYNLIDLNGLEWSFTFLLQETKLQRVDPEQIEESRRRYITGRLEPLAASDEVELPPLKRIRTDITNPAQANQEIEESRKQQTVENIQNAIDPDEAAFNARNLQLARPDVPVGRQLVVPDPAAAALAAQQAPPPPATASDEQRDAPAADEPRRRKNRKIDDELLDERIDETLNQITQ